MRIVFFGTPFFAAHILEFLMRHQIQIVAVVCQPDRQRENRSPIIPQVKKTAEKLLPHIPIFQPEKASDSKFLEAMDALKPDLFVVVAYGQILKKRLLDIPKQGCINVHGSLLPQYRGAAPIQRALMKGEKETGITIMKMAEKMDAGDMILKQSVQIPEDMVFGELERVLADISGPMLLEVLQSYAKQTASFEKQDESNVTFAPKILAEDCLIDWNRPAIDIHNQIRALSPLPGAYTYFFINQEKKRIKILKSAIFEKNLEPQEIFLLSKNRLIIGCNENTIEVLSLQMEGKPVMEIAEFLRGMQNKEFSI